MSGRNDSGGASDGETLCLGLRRLGMLSARSDAPGPTPEPARRPPNGKDGSAVLQPVVLGHSRRKLERPCSLERHSTLGQVSLPGGALPYRRKARAAAARGTSVGSG